VDWPQSNSVVKPPRARKSLSSSTLNIRSQRGLHAVSRLLLLRSDTTHMASDSAYLRWAERKSERLRIHLETISQMNPHTPQTGRPHGWYDAYRDPRRSKMQPEGSNNRPHYTSSNTAGTREAQASTREETRIESPRATMDRNQNYQPDSVLADSTRDVISNGSLPAQKRPLSAVDEDEDEGIDVRPHQRLRESVGDNYNREQESRVCKQALANDTANSNPVRGHANGPVPPQNNTATAMAPVVINSSPTASLEPRPIQASQLRRDRKLLALMLLKSFRPNAPLPESVVAILDFIRSSGLADSTWPRENSGCSLGSNKGVLEQWQAFAGILQAFRDRTGFEGSQEAWNVRCTSVRGSAC
jgi:hypothetical protein